MDGPFGEHTGSSLSALEKGQVEKVNELMGVASC
jgi:hypothetical protein